MIHLIADQLVTYLNALPFTDKITGIVKPLRYKVTDLTMVIPVAYNTNVTQCSQSELLDYCPDSTKTSIIYFEDLGTVFNEWDGKYLRFTSQMRLVVWFNYKKIGGHSPDQIALNVLKYLPDNMGNFDDLIGVWLDVVRQEPNDGTPFNKYTYREERNQYITYPYDYVSFILNASYKVAKGCIDDIELNPESC